MSEPYVRHDIAERDWKKFRALRQVALDRLCQRILDEAGAVIGAAGEGSHQRYLRLLKLLRRRDEEVGQAFNDLRRSTAYDRLAAMHVLAIITDEELDQFSEETRRNVKARSAFMRRDLEEEAE